MSLVYGIYPGGRAANVCSRPDNPVEIDVLVNDLAAGHPFVIREYVHFLGRDPDPTLAEALGNPKALQCLTMPDDWYGQGGRQLDLVVSYLPPLADLHGWLDFLDAVIGRYGALASFLQVTLEPNFPIPFIDGSSPGVLDALIMGVPYARSRLNERGLHHVEVGFSVAEPPDWLGGDGAFWGHLATIPREQFADHLNYIGLGLYPDAFSPVAAPGQPGDVASLTALAISHLRGVSLPAGGIPVNLPLHISENGSPSCIKPSLSDQSSSLEAMVRTVQKLSESDGITHYELFSLRDADTELKQPQGSFGLVTDSYEPKQSFWLYKAVIQSRR